MRKMFFAAASALLLLIFSDSRAQILSGVKMSEYYVGKSNSCCAVYTVKEDNENEIFRLFDICGGCAKGVKEEYAAAIVEELGAEMVFIESFANVRNEYYYSDKISAYKLVNGQKVNIHISFDGDYCCIGTPMIFGSY